MRLSYTITQTHGRTRRSAILASENNSNSKQLIYTTTSTTRDIVNIIENPRQVLYMSKNMVPLNCAFCQGKLRHILNWITSSVSFFQSNKIFFFQLCIFLKNFENFFKTPKAPLHVYWVIRGGGGVELSYSRLVKSWVIIQNEALGNVWCPLEQNEIFDNVSFLTPNVPVEENHVIHGGKWDVVGRPAIMNQVWYETRKVWRVFETIVTQLNHCFRMTGPRCIAIRSQNLDVLVIIFNN